MIEGEGSWVIPPWYEDDAGEFRPFGRRKITVNVKEEYL